MTNGDGAPNPEMPGDGPGSADGAASGRPLVTDGGLLLIFDGDCAFCRRCADRLLLRDRSGKISASPSQTPGLLDQVGLSPDDAAAAVWAIDADGRRLRGAAAINAALELLPEPWPLIGRLYAMPVVRQMEDAGYALIASHRSCSAAVGRGGHG